MLEKRPLTRLGMLDMILMMMAILMILMIMMSRLGMLAKAKTHEDILRLVDAYSLRDNEFYFDRDPATFNCVLNFYRTDRLHVIDEICILDYADDLEFWMIKELNLEICCIDKES